MIDGTRRTRMRLTSALGLGLVAALALSSCAAPETGTTTGAAGSSSLMLAADNGSPTFVKNFNPFVIEKRNMSLIINEPLMVVNALDGKSTNFLQSTGIDARHLRLVVDAMIVEGTRLVDEHLGEFGPSTEPRDSELEGPHLHPFSLSAVQRSALHIGQVIFGRITIRDRCPSDQAWEAIATMPLRLTCPAQLCG